MIADWRKHSKGGWRCNLDQGRFLGITSKKTGYCVRLWEGSTLVKTSWPWRYLEEAKAGAESLADELGWFAEPPGRLT